MLATINAHIPSHNSLQFVAGQSLCQPFNSGIILTSEQEDMDEGLCFLTGCVYSLRLVLANFNVLGSYITSQCLRLFLSGRPPFLLHCCSSTRCRHCWWVARSSLLLHRFFSWSALHAFMPSSVSRQRLSWSGPYLTWGTAALIYQ